MTEGDTTVRFQDFVWKMGRARKMQIPSGLRDEYTEEMEDELSHVAAVC